MKCCKRKPVYKIMIFKQWYRVCKCHIQSVHFGRRRKVALNCHVCHVVQGRGTKMKLQLYCI